MNSKGGVHSLPYLPSVVFMGPMPQLRLISLPEWAQNDNAGLQKR